MKNWNVDHVRYSPFRHVCTVLYNHNFYAIIIGNDSNVGILSEQSNEIKEGIRSILPDINSAAIVSR